MLDRKGNELTYPKVVPQLPFTDAANTYFFDDTYNSTCGGAGGAKNSRVGLTPPPLPGDRFTHNSEFHQLPNKIMMKQK